MKAKIITLFFFLLASLPMKTLASLEILSVEDKTDIELEGDTEDERKKSLVVSFKAYQEDNTEVCVFSNETHSAVTIRILNISGQTMDYYCSGVSPLQIVSFDTSNYTHGTYTLVISTPMGTYLSGVFEI